MPSAQGPHRTFGLVTNLPSIVEIYFDTFRQFARERELGRETGEISQILDRLWNRMDDGQQNLVLTRLGIS